MSYPSDEGVSRLLESADHDYHVASREEVAEIRQNRNNGWAAACACGVALGLAIAIAGLIMVALFTQKLDSHTESQFIDSVCNRGENSAENLVHCQDVLGVPGYPLVSADVGEPKNLLVSRIEPGVGAGIIAHPGSHLEWYTKIESLTPALILGVDNKTITIDVDLPAVNITPCNVTCEENYFLHIPNALLGYGFALGTDHIFADDNSHPGSAILGGYANAIVGASGAVIVGGRYNNITGTFCSLIGGGRNNTITSPRAAIVIGQYNTVAAGQSIVGAGQNNTIVSTLLANAILAGEENDVIESERSAIGAGYQCRIEDSSDSGIYSGKQNSVLGSVASLVGAGTDNVVNTSTASGVVVGRANSVSGTSYGLVGGGEQNSLVDSWGVMVGAGVNNSVSGSYHSGVLTGDGNSLSNSNRSCVLAGLDNAVSDATLSGIVAGEANVLSGTTLAFIGSGLQNEISSATPSTASGIVVGSGNLISGVVAGGFIGAGDGNSLQMGVGGEALQYVAVLAGEGNVIESTSAGVVGTAYSLVGVGSGNVVRDSTYSAVVAGADNTIQNGTHSFVGAGTNNSLTAGILGGGGVNNLTANAVIVGSDNLISGYTKGCLIGAGLNNTIEYSTGDFVLGFAGIVAGEGNRLSRATSGVGVSQDDWALIGAGYQNTVTDSRVTMIGAGEFNTVVNGSGVFFGAGSTNTVTSPVSLRNVAIVAGTLNLVDGNAFHTFMGSGNMNIVRLNTGAPSLDVQAIVAGQSNVIESFVGQIQTPFSGVNVIGAGISNQIRGSQRSGIVSGGENIIANASYAFMGAGLRNVMNTTTAEITQSAIVAGTLNWMSGNVLAAFVGAGSTNTISVPSGASAMSNSAIVAGVTNVIRNAVGGTGSAGNSFVGAGNGNALTGTDTSTVVAGVSNTITNATRIFIGAGASNVFTGTSNTAHCGIVAGTTNSFLATGGGIALSFIGAGSVNTIEWGAGATGGPAQVGIVAGASNRIDSVAGGVFGTNFCFIGAGFTNLVRASTRAAIIAGESNTIANATSAFIGSGFSNEISSLVTNSRNAIVSGNNNSIFGPAYDSFVGCGQNNVLENKGTSGIAFGRQAIIAGANNIIETIVGWVIVSSANDNNIIGAGVSNKLQSCTRAAIVAGESNLVANSTSTFIGAGLSNEITAGSLIARAAIVSGNNNSIFGTGDNTFIGCGTNNLIDRSTATTAPTNNAIVAGSLNTMTGAGGGTAQSQNFIGAGTLNVLTRTIQCAIVSGTTNSISSGLNAINAFIGAGTANTMDGSSYGVNSSAIVAGVNNTINLRGRTIFIGVGSGNLVTTIISGTPNEEGQFIGAGNLNTISRTLGGTTSFSYNFIGAGSGSTITNCAQAGIVAGTSNSITSSTGAFIAVGTGSSITSANYASILSGQTITVSGSLAINTAVSQHARILQSFETPGITVIAGSSTVALGNHIYLANGVTATLALGNSGTIPDGFNFRIRDIVNVNANPITLSCAAAGTCVICPPTAACTAAGGTTVLNTQYMSQMYVFQASAQRWVGMAG